jgi:hypothetical protein
VGKRGRRGERLHAKVGLQRVAVGPVDLHLRDRGHQRPSAPIRGHQGLSGVIRGHQRSSTAIRYHLWPSEAISRNQWQSVAISGHQWQSEAISLSTCLSTSASPDCNGTCGEAIRKRGRRGEHLHASERIPRLQRHLDRPWRVNASQGGACAGGDPSQDALGRETHSLQSRTLGLHAMRDAISGTQWHAEAHRGTPRPSRGADAPSRAPLPASEAAACSKSWRPLRRNEPRSTRRTCE